MTAAASPEAVSPPKATMPPLDARAPRPPVVRLKRNVVAGLVMSGAGLVAGALAWAFLVQPELRANAQVARNDKPTELRGDVRPSERVTDGPASYARLDELPEPRRLSGAKEDDATPPSRTATDPPARPAPPPPRDRLRSEARGSDLFFAASRASGQGGAEAGPARAAGRDYAAVYNGHELLPPLSPYEVKAGTALPAALLTAVNTARAGPVVATLTESVFDTVTGRHLLIPQGSRLLGRHEGDSRHGDNRAVIVWDRLILPNGKSLRLSAEPGVDAKGAAGVKGEVDRRLFPLVVATLFSGAITTLGQAARDRDDRSGGLAGDAGDAASIEAARVGGKLIDRELQVRPTIRLRQGERVRVLITRDLILEAYRP